MRWKILNKVTKTQSTINIHFTKQKCLMLNAENERKCPNDVVKNEKNVNSVRWYNSRRTDFFFQFLFPSNY